MVVMPPTTPFSAPAFSRRTLLAGSAAALGALLVGCTSSDSGTPTVTPQQADELAGQVTVQESLVAASGAAAAADRALGAAVADLAAQAQQQLDRLKAAAPGPRSSASSASSSSSASPSGTAPPAAPEARAWLRGQVAATADSHATACQAQTGPRAALLGSIAAGLRGQDQRLA